MDEGLGGWDSSKMLRKENYSTFSDIFQLGFLVLSKGRIAPHCIAN